MHGCGPCGRGGARSFEDGRWPAPLRHTVSRFNTTCRADRCPHDNCVLENRRRRQAHPRPICVCSRQCENHGWYVKHRQSLRGDWAYCIGALGLIRANPGCGRSGRPVEFPLLMAIGRLPPLAAGNSVVLKPPTIIADRFKAGRTCSYRRCTRRRV